jgi:phosphosulfolactate synthase
MSEFGRLTTEQYLRLIGVVELPPRTIPFDPGYDPATVISHLQQSAHLMAALKISMACWLIADEGVTRRKIEAARAHNVPAVTGGGPFEVAVAQGELEAYLDLCVDLGITKVECGEGFTTLALTPSEIMALARARGLSVQFELGKKHDGSLTDDTLAVAIDLGRTWLDAGAEQLVLEARESARGVGAFDAGGTLNLDYVDRFAEAFGLDIVTFEAPTRASQFAFLQHFGPGVRLGNVRLEELLRVEIFRRGLHSDAFGMPNLRPRRMRRPHSSGAE